ncbi:glucosyltransferase domain-containing protein [Salmonella enterica]|nr:glucosyltransferase domain-containing protein [Salmonella enterica]HBC0148817.1 glucosyltransferase domain-containing protein [Salmonella enterica subsp. houtenae]
MNSSLKEKIQQNIFSDKDSRLFLSVLVAMLSVYVLPIILADRLYIDDILRSQLGYTFWSPNGRPLADLLMSALSFFGSNIADLSPLPLVIALAIFSLCALLYFKANIAEIGAIPSTIIMFFVIANPFLLENLSYKFDVLPMITSISILLIPFIFKPTSKFGFAMSILMIVSSLCFYQASIGFYVCLAVIEYFLSFKNKLQDDTITRLKNATSRAITLCVGYFVYSAITKDMVIGEYNITHSQFIPLTNDGALTFIGNAKAIVNMFSLYFKSIKYTSYFMCAIVIYSVVSSVVALKLKKKPSHIIDIVIVLLAPVLIFLATFVHLCLLNTPVFADRVLISFGGVLMFSSICFFLTFKNRYIATALIATPLLFVFVYSYAFGAAQKYQKEYDNRISGDIALSVSRLDPEGKLRLLTAGTQPSSNQRTNAVNRFPSLSSLVPIYYTGGWWGTNLIKMFGIRNYVGGAEKDNQACGMRKVEETQIYSLYIDEINILVDFDKPSCK